MSSYVATSNTEAAILARIIESDVTVITPDVARNPGARQLPSHRPTAGRHAIACPAVAQESGF